MNFLTPVRGCAIMKVGTNVRSGDEITEENHVHLREAPQQVPGSG